MRVATGGFTYGSAAGADAEVAVVRAIYDAFARRDLEAALPHLADDFELYPTGTARSVGRTEPYRGREGMLQYFADADRVWSDLRLAADDIRAVAGSVVVFGTIRAVSAGTGEVVERRALWTWRLRENKAVWLGVNDFAA